MFFSDSFNSQTLATFLRKAEASHVRDEARAKRLDISKKIISFISRSPKEWDERCGFNIQHIGDQFIRALREFDSSKEEAIDAIYVMSYRFLCEFDFLVGAGKELNIELRAIISQVQEDASEIDGHSRSQLNYASYFMPASISKELINNPDICHFREFKDSKEKAKTLKEEWDNELQAKLDAVNALKNKLDEYKVGFNFVGLHQGFSNLAAQKLKEALWLRIALLAMGALIILPLLFEIYYISTLLPTITQTYERHLALLLPIISLEVVLIYFFRVILLNHRSVKAQIIQIELRQTLCQFIQSYAEYSSSIKKQDSSALEKFESLIFSGILSNPDSLPSTFDGMDQIGNLIKKVKGS